MPCGKLYVLAGLGDFPGWELKDPSADEWTKMPFTTVPAVAFHP